MRPSEQYHRTSYRTRASWRRTKACPWASATPRCAPLIAVEEAHSLGRSAVNISDVRWPIHSASLGLVVEKEFARAGHFTRPFTLEDFCKPLKYFGRLRSIVCVLVMLISLVAGPSCENLGLNENVVYDCCFLAAETFRRSARAVRQIPGASRALRGAGGDLQAGDSDLREGKELQGESASMAVAALSVLLLLVLSHVQVYVFGSSKPAISLIVD